MDRQSFNGFLMATGLLLMIISPIAVAIYVALTGTLGALGIILASAGTFMVLNFYNNLNATNRTLGLLIGPALIIIGMYMMVKY